MNFEYINSVIEEKKVETIYDQFGENYVTMVVMNGLSIDEINFEAFTCEDIVSVLTTLEHAITDENIQGEICIDPSHPYSKIMALCTKISKLGDMEKLMAPSPYQFL